MHVHMHSPFCLASIRVCSNQVLQSSMQAEGSQKKDALRQARDTEIYDVPVGAEMIANILL